MKNKKLKVVAYVSVYGYGTGTYMQLKGRMTTAHPETVRDKVREDFRNITKNDISIGEPVELHPSSLEKGMKVWELELVVKGKTRTYKGRIPVTARTASSAKKKAERNFGRRDISSIENLTMVVQTEEGALIEE